MKKISGIWAISLLATGLAQGDTVINDVFAGRAGDTTTEDPGSTLDGLGDDVNFNFPTDVGNFVANQGVTTHPVFVFQMTGISDPTTITSADFSVTLLAKQNTVVDWNVDAHVIRRSSTTTIVASDYQDSAQLLMSGFNNFDDTVNENYGLDTAGQTTFTTWLQNNWVEGDYLFIGLKTNPTVTTDPGELGSENIFYRYGPNRQATTPPEDAWDETKTDAQLTIVPEPSVALLGSLGLLGLLRRRR